MAVSELVDGAPGVSAVQVSSVSTPSWYDMLGIEPVAPTEGVHAAWTAAISGLGPSDPRFELLNQAAEVLLDRDRRAAYDAQMLAAELAAHHLATVRSEASPQPAPDLPGASGAP
jgi:Mce-associated membrane protein